MTFFKLSLLRAPFGDNTIIGNVILYLKYTQSYSLVISDKRYKASKARICCFGFDCSLNHCFKYNNHISFFDTFEDDKPYFNYVFYV